MTDLKISQFTNGGAVQTTDEVATNRAGVNTKVFLGSAAAADIGSGPSDIPINSDLGDFAFYSDISDFSASLASISGLTTAADTGVYTTASDTYATYTLTAGGRALGGVAGTANTFPYFSASNVVTLASITAAGLNLLDDASASDQRTTLGLGTAATQNTGTSGANVPLLSTANTWTLLQTLTAGAATDTIAERTAAAGVTIDSVLLKDGGITTSGTGSSAITSLGYLAAAPTLTNVTNVSASTAVENIAIRIGNFAIQGGRLSVTPTANTTDTRLDISLLFASDLTDAGDCFGAAFIYGAAGRTNNMGLYADTTNNRAILRWTSQSNAGEAVVYFVGYRIR